MNLRILIVAIAGLIAGLGPVKAEFQELAGETYVADLIRNHDAQQRDELVYQEVLNFIARKKAEDMAARAYFSHIDPDGYGPNFAAHQAGYDLRYGSAPQSNTIESIGVRHQNRISVERAAQFVFDSWLESPGHRRHIMGEINQFKAQSAYGVGYAFAARGPLGWSSHYFVFVSANLDAEARVSPFVEWKFATLKLSEMDPANGDLDADGRDLLWEYSLGSDPKTADPEDLFQFSYDAQNQQGVLTLNLREDLDPELDVIVETTDFSRGDPWTRTGVVRQGGEFRAGSGEDVVRIFRARLEHLRFARLPWFRNGPR